MKAETAERRAEQDDAPEGEQDSADEGETARRRQRARYKTAKQAMVGRSIRRHGVDDASGPPTAGHGGRHRQRACETRPSRADERWTTAGGWMAEKRRHVGEAEVGVAESRCLGTHASPGWPSLWASLCLSLPLCLSSSRAMLCRPRCRLALSLCSRCAVRHHGLQRRLATAAGAAPPSSLDAYHRSSTPIPGWSSSSSSAADPPASYRSPTLPRAGDVAAHGIPGLLKPAHFGTAWTDYHQLLMDSLNADTADAPYLQGMKLDSLIAATARQPDKAHIFNAASMAYNNHFFFRNLVCPLL